MNEELRIQNDETRTMFSGTILSETNNLDKVSQMSYHYQNKEARDEGMV